jgi:hypothetical protein
MDDIHQGKKRKHNHQLHQIDNLQERAARANEHLQKLARDGGGPNMRQSDK